MVLINFYINLSKFLMIFLKLNKIKILQSQKRKNLINQQIKIIYKIIKKECKQEIDKKNDNFII